MGVNTYLLERRTATLVVGGTKQTIGTLRRFFKLTELDEERAAELDATAYISPSPVAALVADVSEMPLADDPKRTVSAHLVLGWDEGRGHVTDFGWDHLPTLGYGVRDAQNGAYVLYEDRDGVLHLLEASRAMDVGILDGAGQLVRHGQPRITQCRSIKKYIAGYAEADCTLADGAAEKLLVAIETNEMPPAEWLIGKRPMDVVRFDRV